MKGLKDASCCRGAVSDVPAVLEQSSDLQDCLAVSRSRQGSTGSGISQEEGCPMGKSKNLQKVPLSILYYH